MPFQTRKLNQSFRRRRFQTWPLLHVSLWSAYWHAREACKLVCLSCTKLNKCCFEDSEVEFRCDSAQRALQCNPWVQLVCLQFAVGDRACNSGNGDDLALTSTGKLANLNVRLCARSAWMRNHVATSLNQRLYNMHRAGQKQ